MDFLIGGIIVLGITWYALLPRIGLGKNRYMRRANAALSLLEMPPHTLPSPLHAAYLDEIHAFRDARGRPANPHEAACRFFYRVLIEEPQHTPELSQKDKQQKLIRARVLAANWRNEELPAKYADMFMLDLQLHLLSTDITFN